jgi:hypothetical protein
MAVAVVIPLTVTGKDESIWLLFPSWPKPFIPQHLTSRVASRAQVLCQLAEIAVALEIPSTLTGVLLSILLLLPSWPFRFRPQH